MEKIYELGFIDSAQFNIENGNLICNINHNNNSKNILYAFANIDNENDENSFVFYVGHTRNTFRNRMNGYKLGNGQNTNNRIHKYIIEQINSQNLIKVFVLNNIYNLNIRELEIDIAAGLEYSLIEFYSNYNSSHNFPALLNRDGNLGYVNSVVTIPSTSDILEDEENLNYENNIPSQDIINVNFPYNLNYETYWNSSNINIPLNFQNYFGEQNEEVVIDFFMNRNLVHSCNALINRNARNDRSPRLYLKGNDGVWFKEWKQANFDRNTILNISIIGRNHIKINH